MGTTNGFENPVKTTETSLRIVEVLKKGGPLTLAEVADSVGLAKSTTHRHLLTLTSHRFVAREGNQFKVGLRFLDYGTFARNQFPFYSLSTEKVDHLAEECGEKVRLITEENGQSVLLYRRMGDHPIETSARIGYSRPLHQLAAGKAILASLSPQRVEEIIARVGLPRRTEHTITTRSELFEELERIRERGYAFNRSESIENLTAIGAAFCDGDGNPLGALSISGAASRLKGDYLEVDLSDLLMGAINEIEIMVKFQ